MIVAVLGLGALLAAIPLLRATVQRAIVWRAARDQARWLEHFERINTRGPVVDRVSGSYDYAKAVAGARKARQQTAVGRTFTPLKDLKAAHRHQQVACAKARRVAVRKAAPRPARRLELAARRPTGTEGA